MRVGSIVGVLVVGTAGVGAMAEDGAERDFIAERAALVASVVAENPNGAPTWDRIEEAMRAARLSADRIVESLRMRHGLGEDVEIRIDPLLLIDAPAEAPPEPEPEPEGAPAAPDPDEPVDMDAVRLRAARSMMQSYDGNRWYERFVLLRTQPLLRVPLDGRPLVLRDLWFADEAQMMARLEAVRVWEFLDQGETNKAANSFEGILALAVVLSQEPTIIGRLASIEVFDAAFSVIHRRIEERGLEGDVAEELLDRLERRLGRIPPLEYTLAGERLTGLDSIDRVFAMEIPAPRVMAPGEASKLRSREENREAMTALYDRADAWAATPSPVRRDAEASPGAFASEVEEGIVLVKLIGAGLDQIVWVDQAMRVRADGLRLMLALEAYRARHAEYPETLEELTPKVLFELPRDEYAPDGRFRYIRPSKATAPAYILSSVGYDATDGKGALPSVERTLYPGEIGIDADYLIAAPKRQAEPEPAGASTPASPGE